MNHLMATLAQAPTDDVGLSVGGVIVMTTSILVVLGLLTFCLARILVSKPSAEHDPVSESKV